jgi:hypothetical protein
MGVRVVTLEHKQGCKHALTAGSGDPRALPLVNALREGHARCLR